MNELSGKVHPDRIASAQRAAQRAAVVAPQLGDWMASDKLPEMIPTRQERSLKTACALIEAGRTLLFGHALDDLSVEMVCERAGTTVGAFYGRFENKHAFFVTLQRIHVIQTEALLFELLHKRKARDDDLEALCQEMVDTAVGPFRNNVGVLRASLQHTQDGMWQPFKALGDRFRTALSARLSPHLSHIPPRQRELRIRFAYQALAGTLVHSALNNPGPLALDDDALSRELIRMVHAYLTA